MTDRPPWHPLLVRQARRAGVSIDDLTTDATLLALLAAVSSSYDDADQYRYLNDRAFEISSQELLVLNEQLRQTGETDLAREHARLEAVFAAAAIGLIVIDENARVVELNDAATDLLTGHEAITGVELAELLRPAANEADNDRAFTSFLRAVRRGAPWRGEDLHLRGSSGTFPASIAFSPLIDEGRPAGGVVAITDVTERHSAAEALAYRARHDSLTGLLNRAAMLEYLERALEDPQRRTLGVLFLDLDRFKLVNDTLGHAAGDDLLRIVAGRIRAVMRDGDTLARLGGDEFIVLCEDADADVALAVAERIIQAVSHPVSLGTETAFISASIGVTISDQESDATALLRDADVAVYRAKGAGRGQAVLFGKEMRSEVAERFRLERALRQALDHRTLTVVYQPIFSLATGALVSFEALSRWRHEDQPVSPDVFVGLAEESGLVGLLGALVIEDAATLLAALQAIGSDKTSVAVNVSPIQLGSPELEAQVAQVTRDMPQPDRLVLEITETALLGDPEAARQDLEILRSHGVRVVLDDFGTGYSSLYTLREFPLAGFKIDQRFVRELITNERDRAIISTMTGLGHALGMTVVAEGAETTEHVNAVRLLGCDSVQGYALSRPLEFDAALELARSFLAPRRVTHR